MKVVEIVGEMGAGKTLVRKLIAEKAAYIGNASVVYMSFAARLKWYLKLFGIEKHSTSYPFQSYSFDSLFIEKYIEFSNIVEKDNLISFNSDKYRSKFKEKIINCWVNLINYDSVKYAVSVRDILQWVGTEIFRHEYTNYWVDIVSDSIKALNKIPYYSSMGIVIIDDFRFKNEDLRFLKESDNIETYVIKVFADIKTRLLRLGLDDSPSGVDKITQHPSELDIPFIKEDYLINNSTDHIRELAAKLNDVYAKLF